MKVLKFGGASLADAGRIRSVIEIIRNSRAKGEIVVVISALQDVTGLLTEAATLAFRGDQRYEALLADLEQRHLSVAAELAGTGSGCTQFIGECFRELREFVRGIWILGEITNRTRDFVMSHGERLSCFIVAEALRRSGVPAEYVDSRTLIKTDLTYGSAHVNFDLTNWNILNHFKGKTEVQVVTGFIACGPENETTTLGRAGSDYTASIIGAALNADEIEIWTGVSGVLTADPVMVPEAISIETLTFDEAVELSHFGASAVNLLPAVKRRIPIRIRNAFDPSFPGTLVSEQPAPCTNPVKGIACIEETGLLRITGEGILRNVGIASRIFSALAQKGIEAIVVTQSSSEHSMCIAIAGDLVRSAREAIELEFRVELHHGQISPVSVESDCSIVAVVGEHVQNIPGVAGKVFDTLGRNGITPRAIAQGASERSLTLALRKEDLHKAMNALHDNLFLSRQKTLNLFLIGPGAVGSALLDLLREQAEFSKESLRLRFRVAGLANSRNMVFDEQGLDLSAWRPRLDSSPVSSDLSGFAAAVRRFNAPNSIVIDCTNAEAAANVYGDFLESSVSVIAASKVANTRSFDSYRQLRSAASMHGAEFRYSTNVGAALPIIDSIRSIVRSGDSLEKIEAVLSGTLSFVFNSVHAGSLFSEAVTKAQGLGYAEPDPRVDLSGTDVARKLLILVREAGFRLEQEDIAIVPYLPASIFTGGDFHRALAGADANLAARQSAAREKGCRLMFIARFENEDARLGVEEIPKDHPFYHLSGNDNIVALTTRSLYRQPLVVRGAGAGPKLTASGIFNDIVHVSHSMN